MASSIPTFVHPASEAFTALFTSAALTFNTKPLAATETTVGTMGDALRPFVDYNSVMPGGIRAAHLQKVDSTIALGTYDGVSMVASFQSGGLEYEHIYTDQAHMYGYSKCHTFSTCSGALDVVGSSCKGFGYSPEWAGYCYESSEGTLQCGRTASTHNRFSNVEVGTFDPIVRCPRGAPAIDGLPSGYANNSQVVVKRLLIAGCMIASDASFSASAEVHVPQMCTTPAEYKKGCLFPGASNYAPGSVQTGFCQYETYGCTEPTALNYNSKATSNPSPNACIMPVKGCTLPAAGYQDVAADTPKYEGLFVGVPLRNVGVVPLPSYGAVVNSQRNTANVLENCQVAIEGCMDETAVNYDSRANVNSNTWCAPKMPGCMMDKTTTNFDTSVTVHRKAECVLRHVGCMDASAANYDSHATVEGVCYASVAGCLDKEALNFGCAINGLATCSDPSSSTLETDVTAHSPALCTMNEDEYVDPDDAREGSYTKTIVIPMSGDVTDYTKAMVKAMKQGVCESVGIPYGETVDADSPGSCKSRVTLDVQAASVIVTSVITASSYSQMEEVADLIEASFSTPAQINAAFAAAAAAEGVAAPPTIANDANIAFATVYTGDVSIADYKKESSLGGTIGGAVGGAFGGIVCVAALVYMYKKKQGGNYDKTVVPA